MFGNYNSKSRIVLHDAVEIIQDIDVPERTKASFGPTVWQFPMTELNFAEFLFANVGKTQPVIEEQANAPVVAPVLHKQRKQLSSWSRDSRLDQRD